MKEQILQAFLSIRDGYSPDAVITNPTLNAKFITVCRSVGLEEQEVDLNHNLYNLRKQRALEDYPTTQRVRLKSQDNYQFAAEIAARFLERRENVSIDRILCDPNLANNFDDIAKQLAPGYSSFEYRFTALSLRKKRRLKPEIVGRVIPAVEVSHHQVINLNPDTIPRKQGIYILSFKNEGVLYLGEARNLRDRVRQHLDHSDRKELARWLWGHEQTNLYVEIHVLPDSTTTSQRKALELELIRSRKPRFNISGVESEE